MSLSQVVAAQTNGTNYDVVPPNVSTASGGNGGAVAKASDSSILDGVSTTRYNAGVFGSTVVETDSVTSAGGTLAYNNQSPIAKRLTTKINGSSNAVLQSGAAQPTLINSIHRLLICPEGCVDGTRTTKTTTAVRNGQFNLYTGKFSMGYPQHSDDLFVGIDETSGDKAAKPNRDVPGRLSFKGSNPEINTTNYSKKTG